MKVHFYSGIRDISGCKELEIDHVENAGFLIASLCNRYGEDFRQKIYSDDTLILINGCHIKKLGGDDAVLNPNDRIDILQVVGGG